MLRALTCMSALVVVALFISGAAEGQTQKNQMVKGTIKFVDATKDLLVINQKVKNQTVDRELSILGSTEFVIMKGNGKKEALGKNGLEMLLGEEGATVNVKCDKDVNVLRVTVKVKK